MQNVAAEFTIGQRPTINAEFSIEESQAIDTIFKINATPTKVSQLENDLNFQTGEQVEESIQNAIEPLVETIEGTDLIGVSRLGNTVTIFSKTFVFEQGIASDTWTIEHNLDKKPSITVVDSADSVIGIFKADYDNENKVTLRFNGAFTGKAYLN